MPQENIWNRIKTKWQAFLATMSYGQKISIVTICGVIVGLGLLFLYLL